MSDIQYILMRIAEKIEEENPYTLATILNVISAALNGVNEYQHIEITKAALQFESVIHHDVEEESDEKAA